MNAIQNTRAPGSSAVAPTEPNARNRQGAAEAGADTFEQLIIAARPEPARAEADADSQQAPRAPTAFGAASTIVLPQALAQMLQGAMQTHASGRERDDEIDEAASQDASMAAPSQAFALPVAGALAATQPPADAAAAASAAPARAAQIVSPALLAEAGDEAGSGEVAAARPQAETAVFGPERSSIMSTLDEALRAPRQNVPERGDAADGSAQHKPALEADGVETTFAADEGVKVSFVSMSRSPAPVTAPGEPAATARASAAAPPAPPPVAAAHQLKLIMEPAGLGAVALNLSLSNAQVSVDLEAQRGETRHALEANRDQLVESLTGAGYDVAHVQVKTASTEAGFDPARREGAPANDPSSERPQQERDERPRSGRDNEARNGDHADDPRARPHRGGGVFI